MSRQGNDLVRKYLWNAAKSAMQHNPAVRALYQRLTGHGQRGDVALGHCMRKLLHLVFAVWRTGRPFDPEHYPWEQRPTAAGGRGQEAAGHKQGTSPPREVVTAAESSIAAAPSPVQPAAAAAESLARQTPAPQPPTTAAAASRPPEAATTGGEWVDFEALRRQVRMEQVLEHLGHLERLRGCGPQRRGPCPVHGSAAQGGRTFSVHLEQGVFQCFHPPCGAHGNVLDLWAAVYRLPLREAALDLARTFGIELPSHEQRRGTR